ncbi:Protein CBG25162 [Caenorhabditis briggsae]|uniref:Protein CBG25162 n=1 Tax=Caenorhabditis briggsae TaxID=6238 RepID=B6IID5_CAEBR|nr:Protein CBG25162 [Caenorhabditis briggsae]CAR99665.1 Protein CBG25162 [Caenorhabditis briggsae]
MGGFRGNRERVNWREKEKKKRFNNGRLCSFITLGEMEKKGMKNSKKKEKRTTNYRIIGVSCLEKIR